MQLTNSCERKRFASIARLSFSRSEEPRKPIQHNQRGFAIDLLRRSSGQMLSFSAGPTNPLNPKHALQFRRFRHLLTVSDVQSHYLTFCARHVDPSMIVLNSAAEALNQRDRRLGRRS